MDCSLLNSATTDNNHSCISTYQQKAVCVLNNAVIVIIQFQNVLAKTDQMMDVVKDMFGDDPKVRHSCS